MDRALPRPRRRPPWSRYLAAVPIILFATANCFMAIVWWKLIAEGAPGGDWIVYQEGARRILAGEPVYGELIRQGGSWSYSPLMAPVFVALSGLGLEGWRFLHVAAALALPTRWMVVAALLSWPFMFDLSSGNTMIFVALAAAWALRGNRFAVIAYLALTLLMPRPFMFPIAAWILWRHRDLVLPFAAVTGVYVIGLLVTGHLVPWAEAMLFATRDIGSEYNLSPSRFLGSWWLLAGVPLAGWLLWRDRPLLAGLAMQPYLLPYYLLFGLGELNRSPEPRSASRLASVVASLRRTAPRPRSV